MGPVNYPSSIDFICFNPPPEEDEKAAQTDNQETHKVVENGNNNNNLLDAGTPDQTVTCEYVIITTLSVLVLQKVCSYIMYAWLFILHISPCTLTKHHTRIK